MRNFKTKITRIFIPFLAVLILSAAVILFITGVCSSVLHFGKTGNIILLLVLTPIMAFFVETVMRSRLNMLYYSKPGNPQKLKPRFPIFIVITTFTLFIFIKTSSTLFSITNGKISVINSIEEVTGTESTDFYKIEKVSIMKNFAGVYKREVTQDRNGVISLDVYCAAPFMKPGDSANPHPLPIWYGVKYSHTINLGGLSEKRPQDKMHTLALEDKLKFENSNFGNCLYMKGAEAGEIKYLLKAAKNGWTPSGQVRFLCPDNENVVKLSKILCIIILAIVVLAAVGFFIYLQFTEIETEEKQIEQKNNK